MNGLKIKICGLREPENVHQVVLLQPDYIGVIFYPQSPRYAGSMEAETLTSIPESVKKVGVFVNEQPQKIEELVERYRLDMVQLHGDEAPALCEQLQKKVPVVKAISLAAKVDLEKVEPYVGKVDYFLFDTKGSGYGGHGKTFPWDILDDYNESVPFFLSGGLGLDELGAVPKWKYLLGVDVNSKFEFAPGLKNVEMVRKGIKMMRDEQ